MEFSLAAVSIQVVHRGSFALVSLSDLSLRSQGHIYYLTRYSVHCSFAASYAQSPSDQFVGWDDWTCAVPIPPVDCRYGVYAVAWCVSVGVKISSFFLRLLLPLPRVWRRALRMQDVYVKLPSCRGLLREGDARLAGLFYGWT